MKRLIQDLGKNSPEEYNRIYQVRELKGINWSDERRWKKLLKHYKGGDLIDLGCLDSLVIPLAQAKSKNGRLVGIDLAEKAITSMSAKYPFAEFIVADIYNTGFENESFNYVVLGEVIEHLEDPERAIYESMRILKSRGVLAISTPLEEEKEPGAVDHERHLWSFSKRDLASMLNNYGKIEFEILRSQYTPVYQYCWPQLITFCKKY